MVIVTRALARKFKFARSTTVEARVVDEITFANVFTLLVGV